MATPKKKVISHGRRDTAHKNVTGIEGAIGKEIVEKSGHSWEERGGLGLGNVPFKFAHVSL